ncbi:hypothetical protein JIG36_45815 [Actinoplanes sp. LDG1-06]|uniref:AAA+ ATPase domain-containing protein n=1 Tax=Paractinoplanes ovalisporus TaxID=2810368 RepID=A0ABS2ASL1_9ACTN|nr:hypothetical protein [Actinoplanes ovalisporus]MBM2622843.1 hypothetical protein [Actinoplanes ovalisporus]
MTTAFPDNLPARYTVSFPGAGDRSAGLGVVVGPRHVITSTTVVNRALARPPSESERPATDLVISFPRLAEARPEAPSRTVRVVRWAPSAGGAGFGLAGLELIDGDLPAEAAPQPLAPSGLLPGDAQVFGYSSEPGAESGVLVDLSVVERVADGRIQVIWRSAGGHRLGAGFGGSPAYDPATGAMVGLLVPPGSDRDDRLAYLVSIEEIRRFWPEAFASAPAPGTIALLHLSDLRLGGREEASGADRRLPTEIGKQVELSGISPDLIVVSGDLTVAGDKWALGSAAIWLRTLARSLHVSPRNIVVVPGERDVSARLRELVHEQSRFLEPTAGADLWRPFAVAVDQLDPQAGRLGFTAERPWTVFTFPDLRVVVAGFNSTIRLSRHDGDERGLLTRPQIEDLADRLRPYRDEGWLRLGVVHHNPARADQAEQSLEDAHELGQVFDDELISVILHGHATGASITRMEPGPLLLGAGGHDRRWQLVTIGPGRLHRRGWRWSSDEESWAAEAARTVHHDFGLRPAPVRDPDTAAFRRRVRLATRLRYLHARLEEGEAEGDIVVETADFPVRRVTVRPAPSATLVSTVDDLAERVRAVAPGSGAVIVHRDAVVAPEVTARARQLNVDLMSLAEFQRLTDLSPVVRRQAERLAGDSTRYVRQPARLTGPAGRSARVEDLADEIVDLLVNDRPSVVAARGEDGSGRSTLLRRLARQLPESGAPLLLALDDAGESESVDRLLQRYLFEHGLTDLRLDRIRYMIGEGRVVLLVDGWDEAADEIRDGLLRLLTDQSRVVVAVGEADDIALPEAGLHTAELLPFDADRIDEFLSARFAGTAGTWAAMLEENEQLLSLAGNPRSLAQLADTGESAVRSLARTGAFTSPAEAGPEAPPEDAEEAPGARPGTIEAVVGGMVHCLAFGPGDRLLAAGRGDVVEIVDLTGRSPSTIRCLTGHSSTVRGVIFLGAGELVSAAEDGTIRVWNVGTGESKVWNVHLQPVTGLAWSRPADAILTGSMDHTAEIRRTDGEPHGSYRPLRHGLGDINAVAAAPDRPVVVTAATDRVAIVWDLTTGREIFRLEHGDSVTAVAFSHDGTLIATVANDGDAVLWNATDGRRVGSLPVGGALTCVAFSPDDALVAVGTRDGTVWLCMAGTRDLRAKLTDHADEVTAIAFPAESPHVVATGSKDGTVRFRRWIEPEPASPARIPEWSGSTLASSTYWASGLVFDPRPDGLRLAASTWDGAVVIWNLEDGAVEKVLGGGTGALNGVARSPDGTLICAGQLLDPPVAYVWDLATGTSRRPLTGHADGVTDVAFAPDGRWIATVSEDRSFAVWDAAEGSLRYRKVLGREAVAGLSFRPLSGAFPETVLAVGHGQVVRMWDPATGESAGDMTLPHKKVLNATAFLHSGTGLVTASGGRSATAGIWDLTAPGEPPIDLAGHKGRVNCVAVHPDDLTVATGSSDNVVRIFETRNGNPVLKLEGHVGGVTAVIFSPDGELLATAARDNTVRLWSTSTGRPLAVLHVLRDGSSVAIRGDGSAYRVSGRPGADIWWASGLRRHRLTEISEPRPMADGEKLFDRPGR